MSLPAGWRGGVPLVLAALALAACQRDPLEREVPAATPTAFSRWRAGIDSDRGPDLRRQVQEALNEIRLKLAGERELQRLSGEKPAGPPPPLDDAVRAQVDRKPLREVLQLGYELRQRRLETELAGLEEAMRKNANLITRPGDIESRQHLDGLRDRQQARVDQYRLELVATARELAPLVAKTGRRLLPAEQLPDAPPVRR